MATLTSCASQGIYGGIVRGEGAGVAGTHPKQEWEVHSTNGWQDWQAFVNKALGAKSHLGCYQDCQKVGSIRSFANLWHCVFVLWPPQPYL